MLLSSPSGSSNLEKGGTGTEGKKTDRHGHTMGRAKSSRKESVEDLRSVGKRGQANPCFLTGKKGVEVLKGPGKQRTHAEN